MGRTPGFALTSRIRFEPEIAIAMNRTLATECVLVVSIVSLLGLVGVDMPAQDPPARVDLPDVGKEAQALKKEQYSIANALIKEFPNNFDALRVLGFVHSSHGARNAMLQCWLQCQRLQPDRPDIYVQLGKFYQQADDDERAIAYWNKALVISDRMPGVRQEIGAAWLNLGDAKEAVTVLTAEIRINPGNSQARYLLGEAYLQLQMLEKARASYTAVVDLQPNHKDAYYGLVKVCSRLGMAQQAGDYARKFQQLEDAAESANFALRRQHDDLQQMRKRLAVTCVDAGKIYSSSKNSERAQQLWLRAARLDASNTASRVELAALFQKQRKLDKVAALYQELLDLEPRNLKFREKLGFLHARLGDLAKAESTLLAMLEIAPRQSLGHRSLAKLYLNSRRRPRQAFEHAVAAVKLEPIADSYFVLGWASAVNGKRVEAIAALRKALQLDPQNRVYKRMYDSLSSRETSTESP